MDTFEKDVDRVLADAKQLLMEARNQNVKRFGEQGVLVRVADDLSTVELLSNEDVSRELVQACWLELICDAVEGLAELHEDVDEINRKFEEAEQANKDLFGGRFTWLGGSFPGPYTPSLV